MNMLRLEITLPSDVAEVCCQALELEASHTGTRKSDVFFSSTADGLEVSINAEDLSTLRASLNTYLCLILMKAHIGHGVRFSPGGRTVYKNHSRRLEPHRVGVFNFHLFTSNTNPLHSVDNVGRRRPEYCCPEKFSHLPFGPLHAKSSHNAGAQLMPLVCMTNPEGVTMSLR